MYRDLPDFDELMHLHKEDPEELERMRMELTDAILANSPPESRRRLEGLQFRINMELRRARTPEARCIKMSSMMHESFAELNHTLNNPLPTAPEPARAARILPFSARQDLPENH